MFQDGVFVTADMTLATLLRSQGLAYHLKKLGKHKAEWRFTVAQDRQEKLRLVIDLYEAGQTRVEPRQFITDFTATRTELYKILGKERQQLHTPASRAATA
jgi:hypothetical protein